MAQTTINRSTNYYTPRPYPSPSSYYTLHGLKQSAKLNGQLVKVHEIMKILLLQDIKLKLFKRVHEIVQRWKI